MRKYIYNYQTIIHFDGKVAHHSFLLRCMPCVNACQQVGGRDLFLYPSVPPISGADAWRNPLQYGTIGPEHDSFVFVSSGEARLQPYRIPLEQPFYRHLFAVESAQTLLSDPMKAFLAEKRGGLEGFALAQALAAEVYATMRYTPGSTTLATTASQAFGQRQGVCQDYAHLLIALCRAAGIPARYANGFMTGLGTTHAWVEVLDGEVWRGLDPTNNVTEMEFGYIKIAHGRDAADCPVNRGIFTGTARQQTEVRTIVEEI